MNIDWEIVGGVVAILTGIGKAIHWVFTKFKSYQKEIDSLKDKLKECEIASGKKDATLELTSKFIKDKFIDGLDNFIDNEKG